MATNDTPFAEATPAEGQDPFLEELFQLPFKEAVLRVDAELQKYPGQGGNEDEIQTRNFLRSLWHFFKGLQEVVEEGNMQEGFAHMDQSRQGFEALSLEPLRLLAYYWALYFSAIVDIRNQNLSLGLEKMKQAQAGWKELDAFGQYFGLEREAMESESFFLTGIQLVSQMDFESGQVALGKAARASKKIAANYFEQGSPFFCYYMGLGHSYSAFSHFYELNDRYNHLDLEFFDDPENYDPADYQKAVEYLSQAVEVSELARINLLQMKGIDLLSQALFYVGDAMHDLLAGKPEDITVAPKVIVKKLTTAKRFFSDLGDTGILLVRHCRLYADRINVLRRFIKEAGVTMKGTAPARAGDPGEVRAFLQKGQVHAALRRLLDLAEDPDVFNTVTLLLGRYNQLRRDRAIGILAAEEQQQQEAQITKGALDVLEMWL